MHVPDTYTKTEQNDANKRGVTKTRSNFHRSIACRTKPPQAPPRRGLPSYRATEALYLLTPGKDGSTTKSTGSTVLGEHLRGK